MRELLVRRGSGAPATVSTLPSASAARAMRAERSVLTLRLEAALEEKTALQKAELSAQVKLCNKIQEEDALRSLLEAERHASTALKEEAVLAAADAAAVVARSGSGGTAGGCARARPAGIGGEAVLQAALGILTLLHQVPIDLALAHQAVAIVVLALVILQVDLLVTRPVGQESRKLIVPLGRSG